MTSPAATTPGIVAFIEAQLCEREEAGQNVLMVRHIGPAVEALARWTIANVAKDRAILAYHYPFAIPPGHCDADNEVYPCQTVRLLAAVDADHPAYRPEWKPVAG